MKHARYTDEEIVHFMHVFAAAFGGVPAFRVCVMKSGRNMFFFRVFINKGAVVKVSSASWMDEIGSISNMNKMFAEANPKILLRNQVIRLDELVSDFGMNEQQICREVFKALKHVVENASQHSCKHNLKIMFDDSFIASDSNCSKEFPEIPNVSSIDELMVWADLQVN